MFLSIWSSHCLVFLSIWSSYCLVFLTDSSICFSSEFRVLVSFHCDIVIPNIVYKCCYFNEGVKSCSPKSFSGTVFQAIQSGYEIGAVPEATCGSGCHLLKPASAPDWHFLIKLYDSYKIQINHHKNGQVDVYLVVYFIVSHVHTTSGQYIKQHHHLAG